MDVSDRVEKESPQSNIVRALEANAVAIVGKDWKSSLSKGPPLPLPMPTFVY
jgi:hypothetical protein